jgi:hypothetical protein
MSDDLTNMVQSLRIRDLRPLCGSHRVETTREVGMVRLHCPVCGYTAYLQSETYDDMMTDLEIDEIGEEFGL